MTLRGIGIPHQQRGRLLFLAAVISSDQASAITPDGASPIVLTAPEGPHVKSWKHTYQVFLASNNRTMVMMMSEQTNATTQAYELNLSIEMCRTLRYPLTPNVVA
jgi:hypothetical protein